ncbi:MAG: hypothetical protein K2J39_12405, partial [Ruminococcus sp.]|nr:hypothetical protein [Ruminococcus sp.]
MARKNKSNKVNNHIDNININIDYEKLAEAVTKAILKSKEEEEKALKIEEDILDKEWQKTIGLKEHSKNENWFKKKWIDFVNNFFALKTFIFYKKDYANKTRMSFAFMAYICCTIFS